MKLQARLYSLFLISAVLAAAIGDRCIAQEIFYFSDRPRDLEVSALSDSLLSFPSPAFARVCQPAGVIDLYPIESPGELDSLLIPMGMQSAGSKGLTTIGGDQDGAQSPQQGQGDLMARHLKLVPKKKLGSTLCAIRLTNEQVINVRFVLSNMVNKPLVDFRSLIERAKAGAAVSQAIGPVNLFRNFVAGGDIAFLADDTPSEDLTSSDTKASRHSSRSRSSTLGNYRLVYVGTDKDRYKAWRFDGSANKDFPTAQGLKGTKLGEVYFSAFRPNGSRGSVKRHIGKGDYFSLYVLSRGDIAFAEMMEKLP